MWWLAILLVADSAPAHQAFTVTVAARESLGVEMAGAGDPVVLVPGLFGSAFGFRKVVRLLNAAGYQTIVVEPLGIGASARPLKAN